MRLTLLFLILSSTLLAQELTLSGTVVSAPEGTPLTGAYVYPKTDPGRVVVTDGEGQFSLALAQPDTLMVSYLGYQELRRFVEASGKIQLTLRPSAAASIEALTVRARRIRDGELASERIGQMDIYLNPAAKADPLLAVNTLPAATNPDETANVSFRGSPTAATGVYLNEVPIRSAVRIDQSNGVGQFSIFGQIPMREVQVYPSSPPVNFSQTSAGAVGLYTSTDLPTKREYGLSLSMAGMGLAHNRPLGKKSGVRMYLNYSNLSAFRFANQQGLPELQRSRAVDGAVQFVSQPSQRTDVQFFYLGFRESYRFTTRTPYYTGDFEQEKPRHLAVLNWRWRGDKWTWRFNQSADWERATFQLGNIQTIPRRFTGHLATHGRYERDGFSLQVGAALNHYDDFVNGTFPLVDYELRPEDPAGSYQQTTNHQLAEVYAYGQWRLGEDWLLGAGIKPVTELAKGNIYPTVQAALR
ncbi:MAG: carboxypeptidase-like regulatory domain-containing protein, partial [Bacteroidota bacterium]